MNPVRDVRLQPVVSWHTDGGPASSRIISVDLRLADPAAEWPYDEEEFLVGCMIDGRPWCTVRPLDSAGVVLHRFGGTYGPTYFRADLTDTPADLTGANLWLTLTTAGGVPFYTAALPLDGSGLETVAPPPTNRPRPSPAPAPIVDDPAAPVFFLSYARPDRIRPVGPPREPNRNVIRLFDDLSELVSELIGSPVGADPGFLDLGRDGGERWQASMLQAIGTCQVMVCLMSTPYLRSEWCARELDVFSRRRVVRRDGPEPHAQTAIVPVRWTPFEQPLPEPIASVQAFVPAGLPDDGWIARYFNDGLLGLARTGQTDIYEAVVWKLALHIQRLHQNYWVEPGVATTLDGSL